MSQKDYSNASLLTMDFFGSAYVRVYPLFDLEQAHETGHALAPIEQF